MITFLVKEWLLAASGMGLILTSIYRGRLPAFSSDEWQVLFLLFALFIAVEGLRRSGLIARIATASERIPHLPVALVLTTFFASMLVTNDAALVVLVPITLALPMRRKDTVVILEALAANGGSALVPFGNPQNLYLYWHYCLSLPEFLGVMAPFSGVSLAFLLLGALAIPRNERAGTAAAEQGPPVDRTALIYSLFLGLVLLAVLRLLPAALVLIILFYGVVFDRSVLRVDYGLLFTLFFFFGLADNLQALLFQKIHFSRHVFLFSALVSQGLSNVPAALLLAPFTSEWKSLLWGTNAGGFGSLLGSLANLIAYKLYIRQARPRAAIHFTIKFLVFGYLAFFLAVSLHLLLHLPA